MNVHTPWLLLAAVVPWLPAPALPAAAPGCSGEVVRAAPASRSPADTAFEDAVRLYRAQRWSVAYGSFMRLAQDGDADAARIALFMHRYGPALFGAHWDASPDELEDWSALARTGRGRAAAPFVPVMPLRHAPTGARSRPRPGDATPSAASQPADAGVQGSWKPSPARDTGTRMPTGRGPVPPAR